MVLTTIIFKVIIIFEDISDNYIYKKKITI